MHVSLDSSLGLPVGYNVVLNTDNKERALRLAGKFNRVYIHCTTWTRLDTFVKVLPMYSHCAHQKHNRGENKDYKLLYFEM